MALHHPDADPLQAIVDPKETLIPIDQEQYLALGLRDVIEAVPGPSLDLDLLQEDEVVDEIAQDEMGEEDGEALVIAVTAVMMIEVEAEAVGEAEGEDVEKQESYGGIVSK